MAYLATVLQIVLFRISILLNWKASGGRKFNMFSETILLRLGRLEENFENLSMF
jgi:hypothetical protein